MLLLLRSLDPTRYTYRTYITSSHDAFSAAKAQAFESALAAPSSANTTKQPYNDNNNIIAQTSNSRAGQASANTRRRLPAPKISGGSKTAGSWALHELPRARKVHQSLLTTPWSCLRCLVATLRLLSVREEEWPDIVVTNGPATALIVLIAVGILRGLRPLIWVWRRFVGRGRMVWEGGKVRSERVEGGREKSMGGGRKKEKKNMVEEKQKQRDEGDREDVGAMRTIYIESWARVRTPSLSLKLITYLGLCDRVIVQHRVLAEKGWGEWRGDLMS